MYIYVLNEVSASNILNLFEQYKYLVQTGEYASYHTLPPPYNPHPRAPSRHRSTFHFNSMQV